MEIIRRRWTITYCLAGAIPGLALMGAAHRTGPFAPVAMTAGVIITGFTVLSSFTAVGYTSPSNSRPRCVAGGISSARRADGSFRRAGTPSLEPYTGSATIFFGSIVVVMAAGACITLTLGKETVGRLELVTEGGAEAPA